MAEHTLNTSTDEIRQQLDDRESSIGHHLSSLRSEFTNLLPQVREIIEKHPIGSVATVLGVGVAIGYLSSNNHRKGASNRESLLRSALEPAIQTVKDHLSKEGKLPDQDINSLLAPVIEAAEKHLSQSKSTTTQNSLSPPKQQSVINDLIKVLVPIGIEAGLKALDKDGKSDQD